MKTYVLYHADCYDGFCAAWVARGAVGEAEFIPVQYGEPPPEIVLGSKVYILDFCYPRDILEKLAADADWLIVIDHHKTAQRHLFGAEPIPGARNRSSWVHLGPKPTDGFATLFDLAKSGGRLTWEFFHGKEAPPGLVAYTEDRDLWLWALRGSHAVNACLRSYPFDFSLWDGWGRMTPAELHLVLATDGAAILRAEKRIVEEHVANAREVEFDGHRVLCVNATTLISEIGNALAKGRPFGMTFFERDGKRVYSLRSEEMDVSEIARAHGGGGHKNASGFHA